MKLYGAVTASLNGAHWSASCFHCFTPMGKIPLYPLKKKLYGP
jgi:hypothetical protein